MQNTTKEDLFSHLSAHTNVISCETSIMLEFQKYYNQNCLKNITPSTALLKKHIQILEHALYP